MTVAERAASLASDRLFKTGEGYVGNNLALITQPGGKGKYLGGWCRQAVEDVIREAVEATLRKASEEKDQ